MIFTVFQYGYVFTGVGSIMTAFPAASFTEIILFIVNGKNTCQEISGFVQIIPAVVINVAFFTGWILGVRNTAFQFKKPGRLNGKAVFLQIHAYTVIYNSVAYSLLLIACHVNDTIFCRVQPCPVCFPVSKAGCFIGKVTGFG